MYPNPPTVDRLNISASNTIKNASIFNILGKKVMSLEINKNSEVY
ncbi:T9SS type A sorting domain-containing protein [uncultured Polaribacter sp.]